MKKSILLSVVICIVIYLLGSFIALDFNIKNWHEVGRVVAAMLFAASILMPALYHEIDKDNL